MKIFIIILIILLALFVAYEIVHIKHLEVTHYVIDSDGKANAKFAVVSDLHNFSYGANNYKLINKIEEEKVEFIIIPGDLIVAVQKNFNNAISLLKGLNNLDLPIYMVFGNHELKLRKYLPDTYEAFINELNKLKVNIINNSTCFYKDIAITGYLNPLIHYSKFKKVYKLSTKELMEDCPCLPEGYNILVCHNPGYFDQYSKTGANLVLSGHLHGGIIRLPFIGGLLSPQTFFRGKYVEGEYNIDNCKMLVSRGLGVHTIAVRVNNRPELMICNIK